MSKITGQKQGRVPKSAWKPGESGNPAGKPKGTRCKATMAAMALLDGEAEGLTRKAVELALAGDLTALRLCIDRIVPPRKDAPVKLDLPAIESPADLPAVTSAILDAVAAGELTPSEGGAVTALVDTHRKALELSEIERRLSELECKFNTGGRTK